MSVSLTADHADLFSGWSHVFSFGKCPSLASNSTRCALRNSAAFRDIVDARVQLGSWERASGWMWWLWHVVAVWVAMCAKFQHSIVSTRLNFYELLKFTKVNGFPGKFPFQIISVIETMGAHECVSLITPPLLQLS